MTTNSTATTVRPPAAVSAWINRTMEALWLLTVVLVPVAFLDPDYVFSEAVIAFVEIPKIAILRTLVGLMAVLWLVEWGLGGRFPLVGWFKRQDPRPRLSTCWSQPLVWLREQPTRWLILAVWFFLLSTLVSTVFSSSVQVSLWGEVPGQYGLNADVMGATRLWCAFTAALLSSCWGTAWWPGRPCRYQ